jgi:hypothetical protein
LTTPIRIVGFHRGIGLHDHQCETRLATVRRDIDEAFSLTSVEALYAFACDLSKAPEARLLSGQQLRELWAVAVDDRVKRPGMDLPTLESWLAGLDSEPWRSRTHYGTLPDSRPPSVKRKVPIPE